MLGTWKLGATSQLQLRRFLCSATSYFRHQRVMLLPSVRQQCAPAATLRSVTEVEVAEAVTAWKKGTAGVPKPRKRVHPM